MAQPDGATFRVTGSFPVTQATPAEAGKHYDPQPAVPAMLGKQMLAPLALTESGEAVVAAAPKGKVANGEIELVQSTIGMYRADALRPVSLAPVRGEKARQAIYGANRNGMTAWLETSSTNLYVGDWRIYAHDGTTTRVLGDSSEVVPGGQLPIPPGAATPVIGEAAVYWPTMRPTKKRDEYTFEIVSRPLDGSGKLRTTATHAGLPAADGPDLYYVRSSTFAAGFAKDKYEIHHIGADGRDRVAAAGRLSRGEELTSLTASGGLVTWIVASGEEKEAGQLYAWDAQRNEATHVKLADRGAFTVLSSSGRMLAWGNESGTGDSSMYLLDLRTEPRLFRVGDDASGLSYAIVAGNYVGWSDPSDAPEKPDDTPLRVGLWR
ncbi:hypothetical protein AB0G04_43945 [Actinoplanes sp. NPDC023801]|uniref:hypothetical protein n=1 Tax=Actinoplanes sp. NPDC023801 TaxID=3154595 RepID=UPI00340BD323